MSTSSNSSRVEYSIYISAAGGGSQELSFDKSITIGRSPDNEVVLSNDPRVSRKHVKLLIEGGQLKIVNMSPKNEIMVNDKKVSEFYMNAESCKIVLGNSTVEVRAKTSYGRAEAVPLNPLNPLQPTTGGSGQQPGNGTPPLQGSTHPAPVGGGSLSSQAPHFQSMTAGVPSQPLPFPGGPAPKRQSRAKKKSSPLIKGIIAAIVIGTIYVVSQEEKKPRAPSGIRSAQERQEDEARALMTIDEERRKREDSGKATKMYDSAQAYYVRGFRDYRQGQFRRAMQSFQAALSFYPAHQLARKYLKLAEVQADKTDRLNMQQGRKYKARGNYELCGSSFQKVMTSIKDPENAVYKEAKILYDVCRTLAEDKY